MNPTQFKMFGKQYNVDEITLGEFVKSVESHTDKIFILKDTVWKDKARMYLSRRDETYEMFWSSPTPNATVKKIVDMSKNDLGFTTSKIILEFPIKQIILEDV